MASEIVKKKQAQEEVVSKSKGVNRFLWLLVTLLVIVAAVGNIYFEKKFSTPIRVVGLVVVLLIAFILAAITNQGAKARGFLSDSRAEARKVVWPTRPEAMQTTLIIIGVTVISSLMFWAMDSIIVAVLNFLTDLRF